MLGTKPGRQLYIQLWLIERYFMKHKKRTMSVTNPKSTGGQGTHFESRVAAYYMSSVLVRGVVRGLESAIAEEVKLQRAFEDQPLDDVIVIASLPNGNATLALQVKRTFTFSAKNDTFLEVMDESWRTFQGNKFQQGTDRFGIAFSTYSQKVDDHYQSVLSWARHRVSAFDFFRSVDQKGLSHADARSFVNTMCEGLEQVSGDAITDDMLWRFLSSFVILHFDFEKEEVSRDRTHAIERLKYALPITEVTRATDLWQGLVEEADRAKPTAGSINRAALITKFRSRFPLEPQDCTGDLRKVHQESRYALREIEVVIGNTTLNRSHIIDEVNQLLENHNNFIEITGEPGVGKSAVLRLIAEQKAMLGPVFLLKHDRLANQAGWAGQATYWQLKSDLAHLLTELSCVQEPCLFIDGIDRLYDETEWTIINDVLRQLFEQALVKWHVIVSVRETNTDYRIQIDQQVYNQLRIGSVKVETLSPEELGIISVENPTLAPLIRQDGRTKELIQRPYYLNQLLRLQKTQQIDTNIPTTEIDLLKIIWHNPTHPLNDRRKQTLLQLAEYRLIFPAKRLTANDVDAQNSLVADGILQKDPIRLTVTFSHNILEDWAMCVYLSQRDSQLAELLQQHNEPLWLITPLQLMATWFLEEDEDASRWHNLFEQVTSADLQPRWKRTLLTAPLQSTRAIELLARLEEILWRDNGRALQELMTALRTVEITPNHNFLDPQLWPDKTDTERIQMAYHLSRPRLTAWLRFLTWLVPKLPQLPANLVWELSLLAQKWQTAVANFKARYSSELATYCLEWLRLLETKSYQRGEATKQKIRSLALNDRSEDKLAERLREVVLSAPLNIPDRIQTYLNEIIEIDDYKAICQILKEATYLVLYMPEQYVDFCLQVMLEYEEEDEDNHDNWYGYRDHDLNELSINYAREFYPPSHLQGHFLLLLQTDAEQGLRLINGLCNHAIRTWREWVQLKYKITPLPVQIEFPWGDQEFEGHYREYTWFRGEGPGPDAVMSALMALEVWMEEQIVAGKDIEKIFQEVLEGNECVAVLGACVFIALSNPKGSLKAALPLVTCPYLWDWDIKRVVREHLPSNVMGDWFRNEYFLRPIKQRNELPQRKQDIRNLTPYYLFTDDTKLKSQFIAIVSDFPNRLPFETEEQKHDEKYIAMLRKEMMQMAALALPANYSWQETAEKGTYYLIYSAPQEIVEQNRELLEIFTKQDQVLRILNWVYSALEKDELSQAVTFQEALRLAKQLDMQDVFEPKDDDDRDDEYLRGMLAGVAAVTVRLFLSELDDATFNWCRNTLDRAVGLPNPRIRSLIVRQSGLIHDPTTYAVYGLSALVISGKATQEEKENLLFLVAHPVEQVTKAVFKSLRDAWGQTSHFCWQVLVLGVRLLVTHRQNLPRQYEVLYSELEFKWIEGIYLSTLEEMEAGIWGQFPAIPSPWTYDPNYQYREGYRPSDILFRYDLASKFIFDLPLDFILTNEQTRKPFINLIREVLAWTIQKTSPPFSKSSMHEHHTPPYEWNGAFMRWLGLVSHYLTQDECQQLILEPIRSTDDDAALRFTESFMGGIVAYRFRQDEAPDAATLELWRNLLKWICQHKMLKRYEGRDFLPNDLGDCISLAILTRYGYHYFDSPWPGLESYREFVEQWIVNFSPIPAAFYKLIIFLDKTGWDWVPEPAFTWLEEIILKHKNNPFFWITDNNGERVTRLLLRVWQEKRNEIVKSPDLIRKLSTMTDIMLQHGVGIALQIQQDMSK